MRQTDQKAIGSFLSINTTLIYIEFFNIVKPAWDTESIIAGDEAHNKDILRVKMFAEQC